MRADYHMHLEPDDHPGRAPYTVERIEAYAEAARSRGIEEIGITEHMHRFSAFAPMMRAIAEERRYAEQARWMPHYFTEDLDAYVNAVLRAKERGLPVKLSIEIDYLPGDEEALAELLDQYPWDYVLGSVHFLGTWGIDWSIENGWGGRNVGRVYEWYFQTLRDAARSGLFDVLAHPDLVKKFGHRPDDGSGEPTRLSKTVRAIADAGLCIEVSTAGLHKPVGEMYPSHAFLRRCRAEEVPITLASDAHVPEHIGRDFDRAVEWAKDAGYGTFVRFACGRRLHQALN